MSGKGTKRFRLVPLLFFGALALASCASRTEIAARVAAEKGMVPRVIPTQNFDIATWVPRKFEPGQPLIVYIEGDGLAFITVTQISDDPTPVRPMAMDLAVRDARPNVVYIARPCQYVAGAQKRNCYHPYWTNARFASEVVGSVNAVIERLVTEAGAPTVKLYGYSGGGAIAALVAATRKDVVRLVTVAGVLDHATWTRLDGMTPLSYSLNPVSYVAALEKVPQLHYIGADDDVVPSAVAKAYQARFPSDHRPELVIVPGVDHDCCWTKLWPGLLNKER
jgi:pimeloyl-ACP methyl ester carboxylesterase